MVIAPHKQFVIFKNQNQEVFEVDKKEMKKYKVKLILICISSLFAEYTRAETFTEELFISPLANGDLLATFNFVTLSPVSKSRHHFDLMPR